MCNACDARHADPRWKAFVQSAFLEVLTVTEAKKVSAGQPGYVSWTYCEDAAKAEVQAATMAITHDEVHAAHTHDVLVCLN